MDIPTANHRGVTGQPAHERISRRAAGQDGVVTFEELVSDGVDPGAIRSGHRNGMLIPLHRGVYAVGHAGLPRKGFIRAAAAGAGPEAAASHMTAAELWDLRGRSRYIEVVRPYGNRRQGGPVKVHRTRSLRPTDVCAVDGIPTTTVVRTLLDIAPRLDEQQIERVLTRADRLELLDWRELQSRVLKPTHSRGIARLRRCVELANPLAVEAASETEEMFLALWRSTGWPDPVVNVSIEGFVVDFLWPECGVIVECDGYAYHSDRVAFERDRARDMKLKVAGYEVIRVTHRMLRDDPEGVLETVAEVLNARAGRIRDLAGQGS